MPDSKLHGFAEGSLAPDVAALAGTAAVEAVTDTAPLATARAAATVALRRHVTIRRDEAARMAAAVR